MMAILQAKLKILIHKPWNFIITTIASIAFAFVFSQIISVESTSGLNVPIVAGEKDMQDTIIGEQLTNSEIHYFHWVDNDELNRQIINGNVELGVVLYENHFEIVEGMSSANIYLIEQYIRDIYEKLNKDNLLTQIVTEQFPENEAKQKLQSIKNAELFTLNQKSFRQKESDPIDYTYQSLFGITLFFVIYTIAYRVLSVLIEKQGGIWDRMILSPVSKWQMYTGNFLYSFLTGYIQVIVVFAVFRFIIGVNFNGNFLLSLVLILPYVFTIVALSILITGIVKNVQQFNATIPIVAVSMAMIGGAYWPLEAVESELILGLSKFMPITYGIEILNGIVVFNLPLNELLMPFSILILMGVMMMGIGIHLMEQRHV